MENKNKNNVDIQEIEKFNLLAHKWWDPTSEFKPLHEINPLRLNFIKSSVNIKGKKILDVGCGGGILSESLANEGADVTGIDQGDRVIKIAKLHAKESGIKVKYKHINIEDFYKNTDERFDVITCLEMLEHVPDPNSIINTCSKLLMPGGKIYFSTINKNLKAFLFAIIGAEYILNLLPKGTHEYKKFIKPSQLQAWANSNGLSFDSIIGMTYNPITQKYKLSQDTSVNYIVEVSSVND
ncbi:bifunctional 2-polyprenyl-6-hydroxyphenol methylase/3-demethylubiquinol 3-O-methyltransferase UbiG [Methylophilaceae bacterium]|jgi:2-polyprenyl-6-hydroxyphenyl methylase/3-demethylubiquinone-9 3-methyltransferase|nr:bifunctional 2-polyprenyl-6-hydroxyphenol methylase/3-demethylubiquinol 3-O-methyltransferase UbiG [Methylophilaceae bacterium]MDA7842722.1 bifunctional 2-polyprenyl-6-hydroxyphenol methylase/3-demethylubiquinol 3-O-methyltransferase UbiG [Methylophilaceae bacterium]|tara:strand:- start:693 stop:1409 length:717 start_codon:yes stop_codon:yes gene_type:complete